MTIHLTYDQAVDELLKAVKERGDRYVYPEDWRDDAGVCRYVLEDGQPACIVGQVFHQLGADLTPLIGFVGSPVGAMGKLEMTAHPSVYHLLSAAQESQDDGIEWGVAVSSALAVVDPSAVA